MVGNHVADLVSRYGEDSEVPHALTDYIKARQGYDYSHHGQAGNPTTDFVPDNIVDRFCVLGTVEDHVHEAGAAKGPRRRPVQHLPHARRDGGDAGRLRTGDHTRPEGEARGVAYRSVR
jgi:hypothetical protein